MSKRDLILVESPVKAKKIQSLLGGRYLVLATVGHLMDLPSREMGVAVGTKGEQKNRLVLDWKPVEKKPPKNPRKGARKPMDTITYLRRNMAQCGGQVILATDDDREGETIAAHCIKVLNLSDDTPRIRFNVLTEEAIIEALDNPDRVDMQKVEAQEARRALDRIIGYTMSPKLTRRLRNELGRQWVSIGRVQAPTLGAVAAQARARKDFKPSSQYAPGYKVNGVFFELPVDPCATREEAEAIAAKTPPKTVATRAERDRRARPRPAVNTNDVLKAFSRTMGPEVPSRIMQDLHNAGAITYHRTDARTLDTKWVGKIRAGLGAEAGQGDPPGGRKVAHQQGAHEAIRPAKAIVGVPKEVTEMSRGHQSVYRFIANRAVAACMQPAIDRVAKITLDNGAVAELAKEKSKGWRKLSPGDSPKDPPQAAWVMQKGDAVEGENQAREIKAKRPAAPTAPWVLGWMESNGVGRPSTFSATLERLNANKMVRSIKPKSRGKEAIYETTTKGSLALEATEELAPSLLKPEYTERMEASLDRIASGDARDGEAVRLVEEGAALAGQKVARVGVDAEMEAQMQ